MIYSYQYNGQMYTVTLEPQTDGRYTAAIGERTYRVEAVRLGKDGWRLVLSSGGETEARERLTVYSAVQGEKRFVCLNGNDYTLSIPDKRGRRKASAGGGDLTAQMPGQVVSVAVSEGDAVERGQTLVILEAMKMEIRVAAPRNGRVKRLLVQKGQVVERGQVLLELE